MKGKATIELFDSNGKLINKKIEYNLVTDAVTNLCNQNYVINALNGNGGDVANCYTPIWKSFCNVLLFTKSLDEKLIIPNKDALSWFTGNSADADHVDTSNLYQGTFDAANSTISSEKLDLSFIFPLNSVGGDIGSICLTSINGGNAALANGTESLFLSYTNQDLQTSGNTCGVGVNSKSNNYIPYINKNVDGYVISADENGNLVCVKEVDETHILIKTYSTSKEVNFSDTFYKLNSIDDFNTIYGGTIDNLPMVRKESEEIIELVNGYDSLLKSSVVGNYLYLPKYNNGTFYLYRISFSDFKVTYQNTNIVVENIRDYINTKDNLYITNNSFLYVVKLSDYKDTPYLFESTYNKIETIEDNLTPLLFKDTIALMNTKNIIKDETRNIYFLTNTNIFNKCILKFDNNCDNIINFGFNFSEPVFSILCEDGDYTCLNANVFTSYLATINNLTTVCTKYETQVMKIRYELTTSDYKE